MEHDNRYFVRRMKDGDIPQALEIDLDAFPTQWPHPNQNSFHHELRNKLAHYIVAYRHNSPASSSDNGQKTIGLREIFSYVRHLFDHDRFFGPEPPPREYLAGIAGIWMMVDEAHIVTIAVRRSHQRQGFGEWLLINIIELAMQLQAKVVTLEVRMSNRVAQALYEKYGFARVGTRQRYYSDNGEDAVIMTTDDLIAPAFQARFRQLKAEHRVLRVQCYPVPELTTGRK
jgi:ribosomal-protein-alanine N-acetyltransferase